MAMICCHGNRSVVFLLSESLTYSCFCNLMKKMVENFPGGTAMDNHLANMRSLVMVSQ